MTAIFRVIYKTRTTINTMIQLIYTHHISPAIFKNVAGTAKRIQNIQKSEIFHTSIRFIIIIR